MAAEEVVMAVEEPVFLSERLNHDSKLEEKSGRVLKPRADSKNGCESIIPALVIPKLILKEISDPDCDRRC